VPELLEKIEEMWAGNKDPYYEVDLDRAAQIEAKKEAEDKMARRLKKISERQSRVLKELNGGEESPVTDIRIVLVGQKCSGKSRAGNMILFNNLFDLSFNMSRLKKNYQDQRETSTFVKHEGNFNGVKVSVVETPGWFTDPTPPDWIKGEVLHSVSMCSPGPHVFLLVVPISRAFTEKDLKALVEILRPLTERVWRHCMVLFTWGDWLNDLPVENYIAREGKELQELLEKCGNRYHVLNPIQISGSIEVKKLLQKLIDMVTQNKGCFTTEDKQKKFQVQPWQKQLIEEEWNRRAQELVERILKVLAKEPEEPTVPSKRMTNSMNEFYIPDRTGFVRTDNKQKSRQSEANEMAADISNSDDAVPLLTAQSHPAAELRIVLIGGRELNGCLSGRSSAGNIILGENVFDTSIRTAHSEAKQQEVLGRQVTVVDTPGCWWGYQQEDTPKLDRMEVQNSIQLCPPGPHVFLLVIPVGLYLPQRVKSSLKENLELFNADVFSHTILLFTADAPCSDETIESNIRRGPTLQWILQQCGNRKHVLNIRDREDRDQVKMLFEKIEIMVANNGGRHCPVDRRQGEALRKEMTDLSERASRRFDQVQKQRRKLKELIEDAKSASEHSRLVLVGAKWAGKSSTGNSILRKNAFNVNNNGRITHSEISHSVVEGRRLTVVDSPGWFYIHTLQDTNEMDKLEIENSVYLCPPGPHAVILVVHLAAAMNTSYLRCVQEHMSLFREDVWKHTLVLFTRGDWLGVKTVEERIESEECLQWIVNKCGNRYHVLNNMDQSDKTQVKELLEKIEEMWTGNEDPYYEVDLDRAAQIEAKK
ncbi:hypothetical protein XENOCAPTIV_007619, partial [Xenoophorus captivus]